MYHRGVFCEKMCICRGSCWHFLHSVEAHLLKRVLSSLVCFSYRTIFQPCICGRQRVWQCYSKNFTSRYSFNILEKADRETISSCQLPQQIVGSLVFLWIAMKHPVRCLECLNPQDLKDSTFAEHADIKCALCINSKVIRVLNAWLQSLKTLLEFPAKEVSFAFGRSAGVLHAKISWGG